MNVVSFFTSIFHRTIFHKKPVPLIPPIPRLALTAEQGYGYFPATPGLTLKDGRYEVSRMLGSGEMSSVFLVHDVVANRCVIHPEC